MKAIKTKPFGLILAGGYSARMGQDKALLEFHGKPQIERVRDLLQKYCARVFLSKRKEQQAYPSMAFIDDHADFQDQGPLGGILSAMKQHPGVDWLVMACDLPFVNDEAIQTLLQQRNDQKMATAFVSSYDSLPEPLCAIWESHCYSSVLKLFNDGVHCPRKVLIKSDVHLLKQKDPHWLENVNTPQEYQQIKHKISSI